MQFLSFPLWHWDFCANLQIRKEYMFFFLGLVLVVSQHARSYLRKFCKKCTMVPWVTVKSWVFVVCFFFNDAPVGNFGSSHQVLNGLETLTYPPPKLRHFWGPMMAPPNFCVDLETFFGDRRWIPHLAFFFVGFLIGRIFGWKKQLGSEAKWKKKPILGKGLQKKKISISGFAGIIKFT